ncbi:hypothetical protein Pse7367_2675 [Thalassoporum mexicanum PCC 7367]|uniref:hypothetical protein n=1 Tax=Thalassoporum mexicanum TaxID=3457544 RepID=UPI00029FA64E|nr:hypothetical protein [Pseudanabaena sp. PCC 7367]AFY70930.1 hypothetical protein Pse7367_2675 [Pseudanabaena sp. PCC 7367]
MWEKFAQSIFLTLMLGLLMSIGGYGASEGKTNDVAPASGSSVILRSPDSRL